MRHTLYLALATVLLATPAHANCGFLESCDPNKSIWDTAPVSHPQPDYSVDMDTWQAPSQQPYDQPLPPPTPIFPAGPYGNGPVTTPMGTYGRPLW